MESMDNNEYVNENMEAEQNIISQNNVDYYNQQNQRQHQDDSSNIASSKRQQESKISGLGALRQQQVAPTLVEQIKNDHHYDHGPGKIKKFIFLVLFIILAVCMLILPNCSFCKHLNPESFKKYNMLVKILFVTCAIYIILFVVCFLLNKKCILCDGLRNQENIQTQKYNNEYPNKSQ